MIEYKFREAELIEEFKQYIDSTYSGHYGQGGLQSSEIIVDRGHGMGFFSGNVDKYNGRYGKKGESPDDHRKDIMKIIHYGFLMLYEHDRLNPKITFNVTEDIDWDHAPNEDFLGLGPITIDTIDLDKNLSIEAVDLNPQPYEVTINYNGLKV